ncbi:MAG: hypothetical protein CL944_01395 [Candidatus Diapherotrites archaeon]|uniref:EamA domain-containing protein n=1 Tax=Candidatus Iainarchaeum sp. TaxID=3101447 RepID=A0A2D6LPK4_9ARCH|nr:hypothetical protein [Candidatus Diapherotrites archaeon]|tara:strand:- start:3497 stop:4405 length:909 start_codon:yes stop_codon:yes gene_type:complete
MEQKVAALALLAAALVWAVTSISYKSMLDAGFPILFLLWVVFIFRFLAVWIISDYKKVKHEIITDIWELKMVLMSGLFSLALPLFFLLAITYTDFDNVYFITYTAPAWVLVLAVIFLGEKLNIKKLAGLGVTLIGVYFIARPENIFSLDLGILFALGAALFYAGDIVVGRELKDYSFHTVSIYSNGFRVIVLTIAVMLAFEIPQIENFYFYVGLAAVMGFFRGIASDFFYYALEKLEASTASIITLSELIFASVLAFVLFGEIHSIDEIMGFSLVILSGLIILLRKSDLDNFEHLIHIHRRH